MGQIKITGGKLTYYVESLNKHTYTSFYSPEGIGPDPEDREEVRYIDQGKLASKILYRITDETMFEKILGARGQQEISFNVYSYNRTTQKLCLLRSKSCSPRLNLKRIVKRRVNEGKKSKSKEKLIQLGKTG